MNLLKQLKEKVQKTLVKLVKQKMKNFKFLRNIKIMPSTTVSANRYCKIMKQKLSTRILFFQLSLTKALAALTFHLHTKCGPTARNGQR